MAPIFRNILLFAAIAIPSFAVPTPESQNLISHHTSKCPRTPSKTPFKRLRDYVIESIWDVPNKPKCHSTSTKSDHTAPANFRTKYGKDVVLRFKIATEEDASAFSEAAGILYLDVWDSSADWVDVRIAKDVLPSFLNLLPPSLRNAHTPLMHDLAQSIYDTYPSNSHIDTWRVRHKPKKNHQTNLFFENYQPNSVIYPWLQLVSALFPEHASSISIGKSAEGRDIAGIRIGAPLNEQKPNKHVNGRETILVVGGSHAREWISTSTVAYLAYQFATRYDTSSTINKILKHYDFIFVPVLNPDGYEYTWTNDRLWRKNRQATSMPFCPGIDLDRAFGFNWDGDKEADNPCTDTYAGDHAFQAVEAKQLADWMYNQTKDDNRVFTGFLDLHSYGQKVMYPYSYSCSKKPANLENLLELALGMAKGFRTSSGVDYQVGSACDSAFGFASNSEDKQVRSRIGSSSNGGSALDYLHAMLRVEYTYQVNLRDLGTYGFLLPKEQIVPSGKEAFEAVKDMANWLMSNRGIESIPDDETELTAQLADNVGVDDNESEWKHRQPDSLFRLHGSERKNMPVEEKHDDDDDEWERVYDEELRRRR